MALIRQDSPYSHLQWQHPSTGDLLRLVPERGGLVTGWRCGGNEILYFDADRFADPAQSVRGGIPVLFPICGGLPDSPLPQHGFARDQSWQASELADGTGVRLELSDSPETRQVYPFGFDLRLELRLEPGALAISTTIEHRCSDPGGSAMPFSLGLHPYFNVSALEAVRVEGLPAECFDHLTMAAGSTAAQLQRLGQGEGIDLLVRPNAEPAGPTAVQLIDTSSGRRISLELSSPLDLVVLWSDPPRPMLCLEPWSGPRLSLRSGDRLLTLAPGATTTLHCRYRIS